MSGFIQMAFYPGFDVSPVPQMYFPASYLGQCTEFFDIPVDDKENQNVPPMHKNFKTEMCRHVIARRICRKGVMCSFAHFPENLPEELQAPEKAFWPRKPQPETTANQKTKLCVNYYKGGSGYCPYEHRCQFIHPADGKLYQERFADTVEFQRIKEAHQKEIQALHIHRLQGGPKALQIEVQINLKIREFNKSHPSGPNYYDLHGMTRMGADVYIADILKSMVRKNVKESRIEVGRGNHSSNNFPALKISLLANNYDGCSLVPLPNNDGVLVLTVL
ncbi:hypothetical protein L3Y34_019709 [Caenorhabditis briggsae]|uniref:C3H1-type domain-containing protein n=1 Tax=Caenorhabditis briggsae TaxID=6238 RepID=A0AAE9DNH8_CAEBR|nr:hypothetical protein L3Y34_019709 [Caenorhabditis briggsae]